jgi:hypothetical protein
MKSKFSDFSYAFTKLNKRNLLIIAFGLSTIALGEKQTKQHKKRVADTEKRVVL